MERVTAYKSTTGRVFNNEIEAWEDEMAEDLDTLLIGWQNEARSLPEILVANREAIVEILSRDATGANSDD